MARQPGLSWLAALATTGVLLLNGCATEPPVPRPDASNRAPSQTIDRTPAAAQPAQAPLAMPPASVPAADAATTEPAQARSKAIQDLEQEPESGAEIDRGLVSWYGRRFHGRRTASGETFNMNGLTAAHRSLPFGTLVRVRSLATGREVVVRINDRGPAVRSRVLDISLGAARALGVQHHGVSHMVLLRE